MRWAVALLLIAPSPAFGETLSATVLNANTTLQAAKPGDTVSLSGPLTSVTVPAKTYVPPLTLDLSNAKLAHLRLSGACGVLVKGGQWGLTAANWAGAIYAQNACDITLDGPTIRDQRTSPGITFRGSKRLKISSARIDGAQVGITIQESQGVTLSGAQLTNMAWDGVNIIASQDGLIEYVSVNGTDLRDEHHPDGIQFWSIDGKPLTSNWEVRYNQVAGRTQGISSFSPADRLWFHDNDIAVAYGNGLAFVNVSNGRIEDNRVRSIPNRINRAMINVTGGVNNRQCGNQIGAVEGKPEIVQPPC